MSVRNDLADAAGETVLSNGRLVLADEVVTGGVRLEGGHIVAIDTGAFDRRVTVDLDGDFLIPGLVDLHTDNLEKHYQPRKGVFWDPVTAAISHDAQVVAAGWDARAEMIEPMISGLSEAHEKGLLRADHLLHYRCEVTHPNITAIVEAHLDHPLVRFLSLMDHAPGDRQSPDIER